ncbi:recombinase family protein [Bradyrhizobium liaoningense]|uniref:recombinase family protein n=1 Tax=Bradyrhizobium liaoningense TaxID=43992 RepID=UPI001BA9C8FE|nr:recombinase family protein [Bradyrhizobium liaoningense]MBR0717867.1 recombinase family protein [Bradyrhizobium liaoningense]
MSYNLASNVDSPIRAAQYLRMSSENQRYSTENQQNAIREYAEQHGYEVVASYIDAGKSGLSLKGRDALQQLLSDALAAKRAFDAILVLDVSRWGRFQNPDQAAHYEFLCRQAGIRVVYCGEPFGDDVAPITTIVKHLKRVMAGEYSRELSVKLARAKRQQAEMGFRQGAKVLYGFRRVLVDPARNPKLLLKDGDRKALDNDKVIVVPGPPEELAVIRRIFRLYVRSQLSIVKIAQRLSDEGVKGYQNSPLSAATIHSILSSELCIGRMTYNRTIHRLQGPVLKNPESEWTRFAAFAPVVPVAQFMKAQNRLHRCRSWDKHTIKASLQQLLKRAGYLNQKLIENAKDAPSAETVANHFGSLHAAYEEVGYRPPPVSPFGNNGKHWSKRAILAGLRKLYAANGYITNRLITKCSYLPSNNYVRRHLGSLPKAMSEAGLPVLTHGEKQQRVWQRRKAAGSDEYYRGVRWTDAKLLRALRQLEKQHGYMSANLLNQNGATPTTHYYAKRFGSLTKARELARLPPRSRSEITLAACKRRKAGTLIRRRRRDTEQPSPLRYRSEDILRGLRRLAKREGKVSISLIDDDENLPSAATVIHQFGSLSRAYRLAGLVRLDGWPMRHGLPGRG